MSDGPIVMMTRGELAELVREQVMAAIASVDPQPARLLDSSEAAQLLGVSLPTLRKLRGEGLSHVMIGDSPRFEAERMIAWLRERSRGAR